MLVIKTITLLTEFYYRFPIGVVAIGNQLSALL